MNKKLKKDLDATLWRITGCYNWAIKTVELRKNLGLPYSEFDILNLISGHSKKCGIGSKALAGIVYDAFGAWEKCWKSKGKVGKPKLKGKRNKINSILFRGDCKLDIKNSILKIPNFGKVRFHKISGASFPSGKLASSVRLTKKASGWYAVLLFDAKHQQEYKQTTSSIGIDTGFKNLITTSDGQKFDHPRELEKAEKQLAKVQRGLGRQKAARLHEKIKNQRKDRNHKISHEIVKNHQEIYITNDNLSAQARRFGKSIASSSIGQLRDFIIYKGSSCDRKVRLVESKFSTMTCSACGSLTGPTGLSKLNVRNWECSACGAEHDRDVNAAINTLKAGQRYCLDNVLESKDFEMLEKSA